jgi:general secretion pathway protein J
VNDKFASAGFTLLELLIAMAVFAIMAAMAYGGLNSVLTTRDSTDQAAQELDSLQQTFLFLQQDLLQVVGRSVRDELGDPEPALEGGLDSETVLSLPRGDLGGVGRYPLLRRISYRVSDGRLQRVSQLVLDRFPDSSETAMELVSDVDDVQIRFLAEEWSDTWPPPAMQDMDALPRAVEITLETGRWGEIRRLYPLVE